MLQFLRNALNYLHLDLTKNLKYDRLTKKIIKRCVKPGSNCIDVGCHKGEILKEMLRYGGEGAVYAFEPIPSFYKQLKKEYENNRHVHIYPYALANAEGNTTFHFVKNAPAYSGIKMRKYDISNPIIEKINVSQKRLDDIIPESFKIDFIKIDVEGAELGVIEGAHTLIERDNPVIIFEYGLGASDYYNTTPSDMYELLCGRLKKKIYTLSAFIKKEEALGLEQFSELYFQSKEYYFVSA